MDDKLLAIAYYRVHCSRLYIFRQPKHSMTSSSETTWMWCLDKQRHSQESPSLYSGWKKLTELLMSHIRKIWWHSLLFWWSTQKVYRSSRVWSRETVHGFEDTAKGSDLLESKFKFLFFWGTTTRFLYFKRSILHQDSCSGNMLYYAVWRKIFLMSQLRPLIYI